MKPVRTKRKDGSVVWLVRWRERGRDSARRSKAFSNKANAEKWITHLRNQKELGQLATASTIPLAELACITSSSTSPVWPHARGATTPAPSSATSSPASETKSSAASTSWPSRASAATSSAMALTPQPSAGR